MRQVPSELGLWEFSAFPQGRQKGARMAAKRQRFQDSSMGGTPGGVKPKTLP